MGRPELNASVKDLLDFYRQEHRLYGRCPNCGEAFRLSEAKITYGKEPPRDLLTRLKRQREELNDQIEELEGQIGEKEFEIETLNDTWREKWKTELDVAVERHLQTKVKEIRKTAIAKSRAVTLGKTIERIAPLFTGFGHHPGDVRPLFEPIDFLVFNGLFMEQVSEVVFVEFKTGSSPLTPMQKSIREAVDRKRVRFEEHRISNATMSRLAMGKVPSRGVPVIDVTTDGQRMRLPSKRV